MNLEAFAGILSRELPELTIKHGEPLKRYTSFGVGGAAAMLAEPATEAELLHLLAIARQENVPVIILGSGTNVLAPDEGLKALVIRTRGLDSITLNGSVITAQCGVSLGSLAMTAAKEGLSGLEFAQGIPGSVGGGIIMNAGAYGGEIKDRCTSVTWLDKSLDVRTTTGADAEFAYRSSLFSKEGGIVLKGEFTLSKDDPKAIMDRIILLSEKRRASQPLELMSAGSTFKRPAGGYAAALIDGAGLKGYTIGGAQVSEKHAGFIVNTGNATCNDILRLMEAVQKRVFESSGIMLEPEVRLLQA